MYSILLKDFLYMVIKPLLEGVPRHADVALSGIHAAFTWLKIYKN